MFLTKQFVYRKARKFRGLNFRGFSETGRFCNVRGKKFEERNFRGFKTRFLAACTDAGIVGHAANL